MENLKATVTIVNDFEDKAKVYLCKDIDEAKKKLVELFFEIIKNCAAVYWDNTYIDEDDSFATIDQCPGHIQLIVGDVM